MISDARSVSRDDTVETDVCVVGAGVAGLALARELIGRDFQVLLLESGDLSRDDDTQALYRGESVGYPYYPLHEARARHFGGSANFWDIDIGGDYLGARLRPLDAIDFEERDWVPHSGWPFGRSDLDPFYERAQSMFHVEPFTYDVKDWEDARARPRLPLSSEDVATVIFKFGSQDVFTVECRNEIVRRAENVIALVHANVVEIETDETGRAVPRVRVASLQGNSFWIAARIFILAAGGIEIPRLLLSSCRRRPAGVGNQHDLVGRFFMEHLHFWSGIYVPSDPEFMRTMGLYSDIHRVSEVPIVGKLALSDSALRREKLLNQCIQLMPRMVAAAARYPGVVSRGTAALQALSAALSRRRVPDRPGRHALDMVTGFDDLAVHAFRKACRALMGAAGNRRVRVLRLAHMTEQAPNPESRVTLADEQDPLGQRRARLDWRLSAVDIRSVVRTQQIIDTELRRAGLGRLYTALRDETPPSGGVPLGVHGGFHHMGTTRMHRDPRKGVVDANCRVHGMANLFIVGPSVFPTGGYANPVLTTVALAVRLADHVKDLMRNGGAGAVA